MKTKNLAFWIMVLMSASCRYDFDLKDINAKEKMVLYCMPCADKDTTLIQLSRSMPVSGKERHQDGIPDAEIIFTVNGKEQPVYRNEHATSSLPARCYYVTGRYNESDRVDIRVSAAGLPSVSSGTVLPAPFPLKALDMKLKHGADTKLQFLVTFQDNAGMEDYYGIRVVRRCVYTTSPDHEPSDTAYSEVEPEVENEPLLYGKDGLGSVFDLPDRFYQNLYIWSDGQISGKEYTLRLETLYSPDYVSGWGESGYQYSYKLYLYKLSRELYLYLESLNGIKNNNLGHDGLAPIRSHYSNVENGIGVVGGCRIMETRWMDNPPDGERSPF